MSLRKIPGEGNLLLTAHVKRTLSGARHVGVHRPFRDMGSRRNAGRDGTAPSPTTWVMTARKPSPPIAKARGTKQFEAENHFVKSFLPPSLRRRSGATSVTAVRILPLFREAKMGFDLAQASDDFLWFFSWGKGTALRLSVVPTGVSAPATANTAITSTAGVFRVEF